MFPLPSRTIIVEEELEEEEDEAAGGSTRWCCCQKERGSMVIKISRTGIWTVASRQLVYITYHRGCIMRKILNYSYKAWLLFMTAVVAMVGVEAVMLLLLLLEVMLLARVEQSLAVCK